MLLVWWATALWPPRLLRELAADTIQHETGHAFVARGPFWARWFAPPADTAEHHTASMLDLTEDGRPLGPPHCGHDAIRRDGGGGFSHWHDDLWFSTSDGSDPRTNGRRYEVTAPLVLARAWLLVAVAACAAGGLLALHAVLRARPDPLACLRRAIGAPVCLAALLLLAAAAALRLWPPTIEQTLLAAAAGEVDLFGVPRDWQIPPFFVGDWPAQNPNADHAGETIRLAVPVRPSAGAFAVLSLLAVTGASLWLPRRRLRVRSAWAAIVLFALQACAPTAALLFVLDVAGLVAPPLRVPDASLPNEAWSRANDRCLTWPEVRAGLPRRIDEPAGDYVQRLTHTIADGVAHVWDRRLAGPLRMHVPARENWCLWLWGEIDPKQREYFFVDAERTIERGVGMCGHVAHALGELLADAGFDARLAQLGGHTVVAVDVDGASWIADPDFGVVLPFALDTLAADPSLAIPDYTAALTRLGDPAPAQNGARLAALFDAAGNSVDAGRPATSLPPRHVSRERWAYRLKWVVPLTLLVAWCAAELAARGRGR